MAKADVWLTYGLDSLGELVFIGEVGRGKTNLACPYCRGSLVAKKGQLLSAHFAHAGQSCAPARRQSVPTLPLYDRFDLHLPGRLWSALQLMWANYGRVGWGIGYFDSQRTLQKLGALGILEWNEFKGKWFFTNKGKIPFGALSMRLFADIQEAMILTLLDDLVKRAAGHPGDLVAQTDMRLYQAQLRRVLSSTLYFLRVNAPQETLFKIGITTRGIEERIDEIRADLISHFGPVDIQVVDTWPYRGSVELYFKHRYAGQRMLIGNLTEYFAFDDPAPAIRDLRRIGVKGLTPEEWSLLA